MKKPQKKAKDMAKELTPAQKKLPKALQEAMLKKKKSKK